ncbi:phosphomannomutase/phosphoglucomutase [Vampirovibrio sp.]|uniref:phosphomannomutase/phosphoglucomutase n=1 Tax=Vampirovibrio sp. TaxID=2717857 RepID=UPI003593D333
MASSTFWGRYDIRAVVGENFGAIQYRLIGKAYARFLKSNLESAQQEDLWVSVGFDARLHSTELVQALTEGLTNEGINVVDLGLSTSPLVYFSEHLSAINPAFPDVQGAIMVTASHNPSEYNGVKFTFRKHSLSDAEFNDLKNQYYALKDEDPHFKGPLGKTLSYNVIPEYLNWFGQHFGAIGKEIKVVVDSGNATAGIVAPDAFRLLGCEVVELFSEPDGRFPNHHPDPCVHHNLRFLIEKVKDSGADIGIAFDGDSDRLGIVDEKGRILPGDLITLFLSENVLSERPDSTVVFDIKSTQTIFEYIKNINGVALLAPSGHAFMKRIMKEKDLSLGGELSGHIFFRDRHWGFDDALYAGCRFIESFALKQGQCSDYTLSRFADSLPQTLISEEIRIHCTKEQGSTLIASIEAAVLQDSFYFGAPLSDILKIDGLRINIENGFFLIRQSNTEPCITLRFEAPDEATYKIIENRIAQFRSQLEEAVVSMLH